MFKTYIADNPTIDIYPVLDYLIYKDFILLLNKSYIF